jgi:hypothetical protein
VHGRARDVILLAELGPALEEGLRDGVVLGKVSGWLCAWKKPVTVAYTLAETHSGR